MADLFTVGSQSAPTQPQEPSPPDTRFDPSGEDARVRSESLPNDYNGWDFAEDFAATSANSFTLNTLPLINAGFYGSLDALRYFVNRDGNAEPLDMGKMMAGYGERFQQSRKYFSDSRQDLTELGTGEGTFWGNFAAGTADVAGTTPGLAAEVLLKGTRAIGKSLGGASSNTQRASTLTRMTDETTDALSKYAPAEALDRLLMGTESFSPTLTGFVRRNLRAGMAGAGAGVLQDVLAGGVDPTDELQVASSAVSNFAAVAGGQLILGEAMMPLLRYASGDTNLRPFMSRVLDKIPTDNGVTPETFREALRELPPGATIFDVRLPNAELDDGIVALNRTFAELSLPGVLPHQIGEAERSAYAYSFQNTQAQAFAAVDNTIAGIEANLQRALDGAPTRAEMLQFKDANTAAIAPAYRSLTTTNPLPDGTMPLGRTPINRVEFERDVIARFEDEIGSGIGLSDEANGDILKVFTDAIRIPPNDASLRDLDDMRFMVPAEDGFAENIPAATLLERGRKAVADQLKRTTREGFGPQHRVAASRLLRAIDTEIAATSLGNLPQNARREWGRQMQIIDAYDLGTAFFQSRYQGGAYNLAEKTDDPNNQFYSYELDEYLAALDQMENSSEVRQAFSDGFRNSLSGFVDRHKTGAALNVMLGEVNLDERGNVFFDERPGERELLKKVLGEEEINALLAAADDRRILEAQNALTDYFQSASRNGNVPSQQAINAGVVMGLNGPARRFALVGNGVSQFSNYLYGDEGLAEASEVMKVLGSPQELMVRRLDNVLAELERPDFRTGPGTALMFEQDTTDQEMREQQSARQDAIEQQLEMGPTLPIIENGQ